VPREIAALAGQRPLLRIKNVHPELTGQDLSQLYDAVAPVEFVKFDPRNDTVAYVCFEENNARNNSVAIAKYDGRMAMGRKISVELTTLLADRIVAPARRGRERGERAREAPLAARGERNARSERSERKDSGARAPKTVDDLDDELSAYMQQRAEPEPESAPASAPADEMNLD
jgi:THO complex subunit 4